MPKVADILWPPDWLQAKQIEYFRQEEERQFEALMKPELVPLDPPRPVCRVYYSSCPLCQTIWCGPEPDTEVDRGTDFAS